MLQQGLRLDHSATLSTDDEREAVNSWLLTIDRHVWIGVCVEICMCYYHISVDVDNYSRV